MMKHTFFLCSLFILWTFLPSCSDDEVIVQPEQELTDYQKQVIEYFKDIALGFEFGSASEITRKWESNMKVFVGGDPAPELMSELESIKNEINALATDGFQIEIVSDSSESNYYAFFGSAKAYVNLYPNSSSFAESNWGLFFLSWDFTNVFIGGHMYVDIERANLAEQKHLLREELTQSLGLAKDSPQYDDSIFQSFWTTSLTYTKMDEDLIRLLYHPNMRPGLNEFEVEPILIDILLD